MKINIKDIVKSKYFGLSLTFLGLLALAIGISTLVFSLLGKTSTKSSTSGTTSKFRVNVNLPKTEVCPINGKKYTKEEKKIWDTRRPILAMIENSLDARPQSGLSRADVVYEAVAEGGITRFLSVFYCGVIAEQVKAAPIRSARIYFVNLAAGYGTNPIYLHQGGANNFCNTCPGGVKPKGQVDKTVDAYAALDKLGWRNGAYGNDMDGGFNIGYPIVVRDQYRISSEPAAWEHSVVADLDEAYKEASKRGFDFEDKSGTAWTEGFREWTFKDGTANTSPEVPSISFKFWDNWEDYDVEWKYDSATNTYMRFNGGKPHTDWELDKEQLSASNVVIMFVKEKGPVDSEKHLYYEVVGSGDALIFNDGKVTEGTWKKSSQLDREVFYDKNGKEISLVRGTTWVELVPSTNTVNY